MANGLTEEKVISFYKGTLADLMTHLTDKKRGIISGEVPNTPTNNNLCYVTVENNIEHFVYVPVSKRFISGSWIYANEAFGILTAEEHLVVNRGIKDKEMVQPLPISEKGEISLSSTFNSRSIIGALNELSKGGSGSIGIDIKGDYTFTSKAVTTGKFTLVNNNRGFRVHFTDKQGNNHENMWKSVNKTCRVIFQSKGDLANYVVIDVKVTPNFSNSTVEVMEDKHLMAGSFQEGEQVTILCLYGAVASTPILNHNSLTGKQGGDGHNFFHMSQAEKDKLANLSQQDFYISGVDEVKDFKVKIVNYNIFEDGSTDEHDPYADKSFDRIYVGNKDFIEQPFRLYSGGKQYDFPRAVTIKVMASEYTNMIIYVENEGLVGGSITWNAGSSGYSDLYLYRKCLLANIEYVPEIRSWNSASTYDVVQPPQINYLIELFNDYRNPINNSFQEMEVDGIGYLRGFGQHGDGGTIIRNSIDIEVHHYDMAGHFIYFRKDMVEVTTDFVYGMNEQKVLCRIHKLPRNSSIEAAYLVGGVAQIPRNDSGGTDVSMLPLAAGRFGFSITGINSSGESVCLLSPVTYSDFDSAYMEGFNDILSHTSSVYDFEYIRYTKWFFGCVYDSTGAIQNKTINGTTYREIDYKWQTGIKQNSGKIPHPKPILQQAATSTPTGVLKNIFTSNIGIGALDLNLASSHNIILNGFIAPMDIDVDTLYCCLSSTAQDTVMLGIYKKIGETSFQLLGETKANITAATLGGILSIALSTPISLNGGEQYFLASKCNRGACNLGGATVLNHGKVSCAYSKWDGSLTNLPQSITAGSQASETSYVGVKGNGR